MQEMMSGTNVIGEDRNGNGTRSQKAKKMPSTEDKITPDSPTCAIDADDLIMRGKIDLESDGGQKGEGKGARVDSAKVGGYSAMTPGNDDNMLFSTVAPSSLKAPQPPPPPPLPSRPAPPAVTPYYEPVPVTSCTIALEDLLLAKLDRPGRAAEENETRKVAKKRMKAKVAPAAPDPPPSTPVLARIASASARTAAEPLSPPLAGAAPALESSCNALEDTNFLLLAEFAHVVRDTLALRGIQVHIPNLNFWTNCAP